MSAFMHGQATGHMFTGGWLLVQLQTVICNSSLYIVYHELGENGVPENVFFRICALSIR